MDALSLARARAARRRQAGGAVMFLVTMMLSVLASVGLYALAAATNEVTTSGSERQATQTHYLSEFGVIAATHLMTATRAQTYLVNMLLNPDTGCWSLPAVTATSQPDKIFRACSHLGSAEMATADGWASGATFPSNGVTGPTPDFAVEYTSPSKAFTPPLYALDLHICFASVTATAYGTTLPPNENTGTSFAEGIETQRARIIAGPLNGALCQ